MLQYRSGLRFPAARSREQSGPEGVIASVPAYKQRAKWNEQCSSSTGRIAGRYTSVRDGGLTYTYEARWQEAGEGIVWSATVMREGESAGTPSGQIRHITGVRLADEVRRLVETAIEIRAAVK